MKKKPPAKGTPKAAPSIAKPNARLKAFAGKILLLAVSLAIPFLLLEAAIAILFTFPTLNKWGSPKLVHTIYENDYRNIIQFEPDLARYDAELTYTLKPGTFRFRNPEFDTEYRVNRLGLRDDDASLAKPDIIVLGDSEAMGWGVRQEETYAEIIRRKSRLNVLNAAISSYGTVREMRLLNRLETGNLKYLIIHYMDNDYIENFFFHKNGNDLRISSQDQYQNIVQLYLQTKKYYIGKYVRLSLKYAFNQSAEEGSGAWKAAAVGAGMNGKAETLFLNALMKTSSFDFKQVQIIVLATEKDSDFSARLRDEIRHNSYPEYIRKMQIVSPAPRMGRDCYYSLDNHMKARGHEIVAAEIMKAMGLREGKSAAGGQ